MAFVAADYIKYLMKRKTREGVRAPKCNFREPLQAKMDWKEKYETLSSSSKNFERDTYKGGRGA